MSRNKNNNQSTAPTDVQMPLIEHLVELRDRFVKALLAVILCMLVCFFFYKEIWSFLVGPLIKALEETESGQLAQLRVMEGIITQLKLAAIAGIVIASPVISYQSWQFIAPALYPKEKKFIIPLAISSTVLFFLGAAFGYLIIFDFVFPFLLEVTPENVNASISIDDALSTTTKLLLGFGFCFQLPVVSYFLARIGMIDHKDMLSFFRYAIVGIFVVSAFLTPPDPLSQILMAVPLTILYAVGIIIAWIFTTKGKDDEEDEESTDLVPT